MTTLSINQGFKTPPLDFKVDLDLLRGNYVYSLLGEHKKSYDFYSEIIFRKLILIIKSRRREKR